MKTNEPKKNIICETKEPITEGGEVIGTLVKTLDWKMSNEDFINNEVTITCVEEFIPVAKTEKLVMGMTPEQWEWVRAKAKELVVKFGSQELALVCVWEMESLLIFRGYYSPFDDKILSILRFEINHL